MVIQQTLILFKPDTIQRSLVGKILIRFEETGLKIVALRMIQPSKDIAGKHYILDEEWAKKLFAKSSEAYAKEGKKMPYKTHMEMGQSIQSKNMTFLQEGPVIALVLEGPHAIELVRKMIGHTEPRQALPGTIRGDFASVESCKLSDAKERVIRNLIHASDSPENAKREIELWFNKNEVHSYKKDLDKHF